MTQLSTAVVDRLEQRNPSTNGAIDAW
jgi:hypothetical protein